MSCAATASADREQRALRGVALIAHGRGMPVAFAGMRIGLLGGSFNPAHAGHRHVSLIALKRLGLQRVWWLVSPQNPLKPERGTAPLEARLSRAQEVARHPKLVVTDMERVLGTRYSVDTIRALKRRYPGVRFVWLMGADNFAELSHWKDWSAFVSTVPIAVVGRPGFRFAPLSSAAAQRFSRWRLPEHRASLLARRKPPAWACLHAPLNPLSSTALRAAVERPDSPHKGGMHEQRRRTRERQKRKAQGLEAAAPMGAGRGNEGRDQSQGR